MYLVKSILAIIFLLLLKRVIQRDIKVVSTMSRLRKRKNTNAFKTWKHFRGVEYKSAKLKYLRKRKKNAT